MKSFGLSKDAQIQSKQKTSKGQLPDSSSRKIMIK